MRRTAAAALAVSLLLACTTDGNPVAAEQPTAEPAPPLSPTGLHASGIVPTYCNTAGVFSVALLSPELRAFGSYQGELHHDPGLTVRAVLFPSGAFGDFNVVSPGVLRFAVAGTGAMGVHLVRVDFDSDPRPSQVYALTDQELTSQAFEDFTPLLLPPVWGSCPAD